MSKERLSSEQLRRRALVSALGATAITSMGAARAAGAQPYPVRPIRSLVPFGPGGITDIVARIVAEKLGKALQQQIVIDNRPSAGGIIATDLAAKAEPDGYTMLWFGSSATVSVSLMKSLPYDLVRDLAPISTTGYSALVLLVNANSPIRSVADLLAFGKANPNKFNMGITTIGAMIHVATELFLSMTRVPAQVVPLRTSGALISAVRGNDAQAMFEFIAPVLPFIESGQLRPLAVTSERRFEGLPNVPTLAEAGVPGYEASAWTALAVPAKTPRPIVERLSREVNAIVKMPDVKQRLQDLGIAARGSTPEELRKIIVADIAKWKRVVETAKIPRQ
ncbi:MAG TPA: tripartite tricarboxylate transporter substrate binding protein [Burkholderiales bacterium]|nr:tripartite tricarboxylate transporter substrate binding protein [Burkholderiales bacterium]